MHFARHTIIQYKIVACTPVLFFRIDSSDYKRSANFDPPTLHKAHDHPDKIQGLQAVPQISRPPRPLQYRKSPHRLDKEHPQKLWGVLDYTTRRAANFGAALPATIPKTNDTHYAAAVTPAPKAGELVAFAHATLFSPAISTLQLALDKGYLINFPGLTSSMLRRCPPTSAPMIKGHLDQSRKNQRSTAPTLIPPEAPPEVPPVDDDLCPPSSDTRTHMCFAATLAPTGQIYSDQTGRFVLPSSTGNNYIMIVYDYDSNFIFAQPFRNRTAKCILEAYKILHARLCKAGLRPRLQRLDNECSQLLKGFMHDENIDFQLVPPAVHRRNAAERAIRTFQNHFIAGLCSVDKTSPYTYGISSLNRLNSV